MSRMQSAIKYAATAALAASLLAFGTAWAEDASSAVPQAVAERILTNLKQARSDFEYSDVKATPIAGLYEVRVMSGPTLYVSEDGKFLIAGDLYGIAADRFVDVQEKARAKERAEIMAKLDRSEEIIFSPKGETKAYLQVFTDVDCGYCQKLHREVPQLNAMGIEVRYLAYPRAGLDSESYLKIATAWCSDDPQGTLTKMKQGQHVDINVCADNPVAKQYNLGNRIGVRGTPALVLADGTMLPGYVPAAELAKILGVKVEQD